MVLHLLKMFSFAKNEESLEEIKLALTAYFAKRVEDEMDALWESGEWNQEKNEAILKEHGPDSFIGRCASIMMGSTETTFYAIMVLRYSCSWFLSFRRY